MKTMVPILLVIAVSAAGIALALKSAPAGAERSVAPAQRPDPSRIVCTDGALTETVYALGFGANVVGADTTAEWPPSVKQKPSIGYIKRISAEGVMSLKPTLILDNAESGPSEALHQLQNSGTPFVEIPGEKDSRSLPTILHRVTAVGEALGVPEKGRELAKQIKADVDAARMAVQGRAGPKTLFLFNPVEATLLAAGKGTAPEEFMRLLNLTNVAGHLENWKPISPEAIIAVAPELIVIATRTPEQNLETAAGLLRGSLAQTPAGKEKRVVFVPLGKFLAGGPRAGELALEFARAAYPRLQVPASGSAAVFRAVEEQFPVK